MGLCPGSSVAETTKSGSSFQLLLPWPSGFQTIRSRRTDHVGAPEPPRAGLNRALNRLDLHIVLSSTVESLGITTTHLRGFPMGSMVRSNVVVAARVHSAFGISEL